MYFKTKQLHIEHVKVRDFISKVIFMAADKKYFFGEIIAIWPLRNANITSKK